MNKADETLDPDEVIEMDWLLDNVVGRLPRYDELTDNAKIKNGTSGCCQRRRIESMLPAVVAGELLMKILVLADVESKYLWDYLRKENWKV